MNIQWYPGHMTKAVRMMEEQIKLCDGVIYVLDARCPLSSFNEKLKRLFGAKPVVYVLCKGDLSDSEADKIAAKIRERAPAVKIDAFSSSSKKTLEDLINETVAEKKERYLSRGCDRMFRFMVAGVPNTGKSTIINMLAGGKKAVTGDKAGVTRGRQWITCRGFDLLDTPGTCPPAFENQTYAARLAFVGSINDDILQFDDVAAELLKELEEKYPERLKDRYGVEPGLTFEETLDAVCERRGFITKGKEYDTDRACRAVVDDFRSGKLGKITLDRASECDGIDF
ncbi:MAG: ribosome biogenesis GTPase YlqF [Clostridia bacterium]|nr:ribosome biogenesis GTPase YlqF [Clostridia bacterium]